MANKEDLLESIKPGITVNEALLLRIYGYSVTDSYYAGVALDYLGFAGIRNARELYKEAVCGWQERHEAMLARVAAEYRRKVEDEEEKEAEQWAKSVEQMDEEEAKAALKKLLRYQSYERMSL